MVHPLPKHKQEGLVTDIRMSLDLSVMCKLLLKARGGAVPFWRRRVCKGQKTPFFSIPGTHRPHIFYSCMSSHPKTHIFAFNLSLKAPWFEKLACEKIHLSDFSPDDPTYFCIFLSLNAKNHALTQRPLIFWACALTECPSLPEHGPYTRIHFIFDSSPGSKCIDVTHDTSRAPKSKQGLTNAGKRFSQKIYFPATESIRQKGLIYHFSYNNIEKKK